MKRNKPRVTGRYGIGEWYAKSFATMSKNTRIELANLRSTKDQECTYRLDLKSDQICTKRGGVCTLRYYERDTETNQVIATSKIVTLCPHRFKEKNIIFQWVGDTILGYSQPTIVTEVGFLAREKSLESSMGDFESEIDSDLPSDAREDVGQIDYVLVNPQTRQWCALELQAVYFSGPAMSKEYETLREMEDDSLPFPSKNRRPDFRSSGPKRLMPQLQIKVPTLRRWGKKMAVVVDRSFFESLGKMDKVDHISNCDIVWFVVDYEIDNESGEMRLICYDEIYTTLERAVEGLTAGRPVDLSTFEERVTQKIEASANPQKRRARTQ